MVGLVLTCINVDPVANLKMHVLTNMRRSNQQASTHFVTGIAKH